MRRVCDRTFKTYPVALAAAGFLSLLASGSVAAAEPALTGKELVNNKCAACHTPQGEGRWHRISDGRRTPEGWDMTVARMGYAHGVSLTREERQEVVKYLADTFGLAPSETKDYRYILERRPNVIERSGHELVDNTCARCHSAARIGIQRRTEDDWRKLVNFHVGQFPSIEYSAGGRDRNWFEIASKDVVKVLGQLNGYDTPAWREWKSAPAVDPSGSWRLAGDRPGWGAYEGQAEIHRTGEDRYAIAMTIRYEDGRVEKAEGKSLVYTKHEWRASLQQGDKEILQVLALEPGGKRMSGRWFLSDYDNLGANMVAVRSDTGSPAAILSVQPGALRAGTTQKLTVHGANLEGDIEFGPDLRLVKVMERSADKVVVEVQAQAGAKDGIRKVRVGQAQLESGLPVYRQVDYLRVSPEHPIARIGDNGGTRHKMPAQLEAIGFAVGPDGKRGTADDVRIGVMKARWSLENLNEAAIKMKDLQFAGQIEPNGLFWPNGAGPNPARKFQTNNAGELRATAKLTEGGRALSASVPLFVTVQRWNDPPIR